LFCNAVITSFQDLLLRKLNRKPMQEQGQQRHKLMQVPDQQHRKLMQELPSGRQLRKHFRLKQTLQHFLKFHS
jgi:hypothetical protein